MTRTGKARRSAALTMGISLLLGALIVISTALGQLFFAEAGNGFDAAPPNTAIHIAAVPATSTGVGGGTSVATDTSGNRPGRHSATGGTGDQRVAMRKVAPLVGDSRSAGAANVAGDHTWTQYAQPTAGYDVMFVGVGGTG